MPLTDASIRRAKGGEKMYRLTDEKGLYLLIQPDGARWWRFDFNMHGKRRTMGLGIYPEVDLASARKARDRARNQVAEGIDPVRHRRTGAGEQSAEFESVARRWIEQQRPSLDARYVGIIETRFTDNVFPFIGTRDVRTLDARDILDVIRRLEARGVRQVARRLHRQCFKVFQMAILEGLASRNPCADLTSDAFAPRLRPVRHRAALQPESVGRFLVQLSDSQDEELDTLDAMRLTVLTAARTTEIRFAAADEFFGLDGDSPEWRLSPERMKMTRPHVVPLPRQAAEIVRHRLELLRPKDTLLFNRNTVSGVISENTMLYALYRMGHHGKATMHGFRGVFSTVANSATRLDEHGHEIRLWDSEWIERCLAHVDDDDVRSAYNAAEYLPQRRRLLQWWADWLDEQGSLARLIG